MRKRFEGFEEGKRQEKTKVGGEPIGLAKSGKNSGLDVLDPEGFVEAEMLGNGINTN